MNKYQKLSIILLGGISAAAGARQSIDTLANLNQGQFESLTDNLSAALSYKPIIPAEPLSLLGFDVGAEVSITQIDEDEVFARVSNNWNIIDQNIGDYLTVTRLHGHKGFPFGLDVGASYGSMVNSNIGVWGLELRYSALEGSILTPALAVRAAYTQMVGVAAMDLATQSLDVSISKGLLMFTPYGGIGLVWGQGEANDNPALSDASVNQLKLYGGINANLGLFNGVFEYDNTGGTNTVSLKLGLRF